MEEKSGGGSQPLPPPPLPKLEGYDGDLEVDLPPSITENHSRIGGFEGSELFDAGYESHHDSNKDGDNGMRRRKGGPKIKTKDGKMRDLKMVDKIKWAIQADPSSSKDAIAFAAISELAIYLIFLLFMCITVFSMTSTMMYYQTKTLEQLFVTNLPSNFPTFDQFQTNENVWDYLENPLLDGIYSSHDVNDNDGEERPLIAFDNRLLFKPRIRMLRVTKTSCKVIYSLSREIKNCSASYRKDIENKASFGPANSSAFIYTEASELKAGEYSGFHSTYGGGGFVQELPVNNRLEAFNIIKNLKGHKWIDPSTRVIFVDFTVYNANLNYFTVIKIIFEFAPGGGIIPQYYIETMKLFRYVTTFDYFILVLEAIFCGIILCYIIQDARQLYKKGWNYFNELWNFVDLVVIGLSLATIVLTIALVITVNNNVKILANGDTKKYFEMNGIVYYSSVAMDVTTICVFISWMKVFKYVSFQPQMNQMMETLHRSISDMIAFFWMFFVIYFMYMAVGTGLFGNKLREYSSLQKAGYTLFRINIGDFLINDYSACNKYLGPIYVLTYIVCGNLIIMSLFLAILLYAYGRVANEIARTKREYIVSNYVRKNWNQFLRKLRIGKDPKNTPPSEDYLKWKSELEKSGYSEEKITEIFLRFNIEKDHKDGDLMGWRRRRFVEAHLEENHDEFDMALTAEQHRLKEAIEKVESKVEILIKSAEDFVAKNNFNSNDPFGDSDAEEEAHYHIKQPRNRNKKTNESKNE